MTLTPRIARVAFSAALALLGIGAAIGGWGYGVTQENGQVGAGFLPVALGVLMAVLAGADALLGLRLREQRPREELGDLGAEVELASIDHVDEAPDVDALGRTQRQRNRMLVVVAALLLGALMLVPLLGLLISLGLLMLAVAIGVERRPVLSSVLITVIVVGVFHLVFGVLLRVPLPTGVIGLI